MQEVEKFPCPTCSRKIIVKYDKKGKPYIVCDDCGVQVFIRKREGIALMKSKIKNEW